MARLLGLYDEEYKSWSLGKVTMLKEISLALIQEKNGITGICSRPTHKLRLQAGVR